MVFRSRRFTVDGRYVQLATSYLPTDLARGTRIMHTDTGPGGIYAVFTETGHAPAMYREEVRCRAPSPDEVNRLGVPASASVIEIIRQAFQTDGRCIEVNRMVPVSPTSETVS